MICNPLVRVEDDSVNYMLDVTDGRLQKKYQELFQKYQLPFTPTIWNMVISQVVKRKNPALSRRLTIDNDDVSVSFILDKEQEGALMRAICPLFLNRKELEEALQGVNKRAVQELEAEEEAE